MKRLLTISLAIVLALSLSMGLLPAQPAMANPGDIYVPGDYPTIQGGINAASSGDTVYVAADTYYENITLKRGVTVQGAGAGVTTIDGGGSGAVVTAWGYGQSFTAKLDGFTITNGSWGIKNAYIYPLSPTITNNIITGNGIQGIRNVYSSPTITNNIITGNGSDGIFNFFLYSSATITNNTITDHASHGILNVSSTPTITNNIITGNGYYGIKNENSTPTIDYNDVWDNSTNYYPSSSAGYKNISEDPLFVNVEADDYHLQLCSPCIDAGTNDAPALPATDLDGYPRILDGDGDGEATVDMGAYEGEYGPCLLNTPPVANAGPDQTVEQTSYEGVEVTLDGSGSYDPDGDPLSYTWTWDEESATGVILTILLPLGTTTVTLIVNDGTVDSDPDTVDITVEDTTLPEISVSVSPDMLWPPNHKMVEITATVTVSDICDLSPTVVLTSIVSNEPDDATGNGDGNTVNDIQGAGFGTEDYVFLLRAERAGNGDGRVYTITYTATDASGNSTSASATVTVTH